MKINVIATIFVITLLTSCKSSNQITYFQDLDALGQLAESGINYEAKICSDDQLTISVSSLDPNAVAMFNLPLTSYLAPGEISATVTPVMQSYLVDAKGYIEFPVIGKLHVAGQTRNELSEALKKKIAAYAKSPLVTIQIRNFKVSVLGEVNKPGTILVPNERVSILDALGMAGDLTIYGERSNVVLIRDINGRKEFHRFDLTSSKVLTSPYFYLQQNDVIYVEPNKPRKDNSKYSQNAQFNVSVISTIVSAVSVLASLTIALLVK